jgi:hypothetical protein
MFYFHFHFKNFYLEGDCPVLSLGLEREAVGDDVVVDAEGGEVAFPGIRC